MATSQQGLHAGAKLHQLAHTVRITQHTQTPYSHTEVERYAENHVLISKMCLGYIDTFFSNNQGIAPKHAIQHKLFQRALQAGVLEVGSLPCGSHTTPIRNRRLVRALWEAHGNNSPISYSNVNGFYFRGGQRDNIGSYRGSIILRQVVDTRTDPFIQEYALNRIRDPEYDLRYLP